MIELKCPLDDGKIVKHNESYSCNLCNTNFPKVTIGKKQVPDFRSLDKPTKTTLTFTTPQTPRSTGDVKKLGIATDIDFQCPSREEIRRIYGTKLQKESLYYIDQLLKQVGNDAKILDLGCGNGGNKKHLKSIGFTNITSVDFESQGAEYLVDVHRLPFASDSFDMILTTATLEHFYNPFIAFNEMSRVLKPQGRLIATGSFWESWHGDSCFHFTPGGLEQLCISSELKLIDIWSGWGFIPSILSHALLQGRFKKLTYQLQRFFDFTLSKLKNNETMKKHKFKTSGSFGLYAKKY